VTSNHRSEDQDWIVRLLGRSRNQVRPGIREHP
jgi:hypothetical protein